MSKDKLFVASNDENEFIDAIQGGKSYWPQCDGAIIRAEFIRRILLELPVQRPDSEKKPRAIKVTNAGLRIAPPDEYEFVKEDRVRVPLSRPVRITGELDISGLGGANAPLPPLELTYCEFDCTDLVEDRAEQSTDCKTVNVLDLSHSKIERLSLRGSLFQALDLSSAVVFGDVTLDWCSPAVGKSQRYDNVLKKYPFVGMALQHTKIPSAEAKRASDFYRLVGETKASQNEDSTNTIARDVIEKPIFADQSDVYPTCVIKLTSIKVEGSLRLSQSIFCFPWDAICPFKRNKSSLSSAVELSSVDIRDSVYTDQSVVVGGIDCRRSNIAEDFWLCGVRLIGGSFAASEDARELIAALNLQLTVIGGLLCFRSRKCTESNKQHFEYNTVIGGVAGIGVVAREIWFAGGIFVDGIRLPKANINQSLSIGDYHSDDGSEAVVLQGGLNIDGINVGKNIEFRNVDYLNSSQFASLTFNFLEPKQDKNRRERDEYLTISAMSARVDRHVLIQRSQFRSPLRSQAFLDKRWLESGIATRDNLAVNFSKSTIETGFTIGRRSNIAGSAYINRCKIGRELIIECGRIDGALGGDKGALPSRKIPLAIDLTGTSIDGHLRVGPRSVYDKLVSLPEIVGSASTEKKTYEYQPLSVNGGISVASVSVRGTSNLQNIAFDLRSFNESRKKVSSKELPDLRTALNLRDFNCDKSLTIQNLSWRMPVSDRQQNRKYDRESEEAKIEDVYRVLGDKSISSKVWRRWQRGEGCSAKKLKFYEDVYLVELTRDNRFLRFLIKGSTSEPIFLINGTSQQIHRLNAENTPKFSSEGISEEQAEKNRLEYLTFFCEAIAGEEGPFKIVQADDTDIEKLKKQVAESRSEIEENGEDTSLLKLLSLGPSRHKYDDEKKNYTWLINASVFYSNALFYSQFKLLESGMVEMLGDGLILGDIPLLAKDRYLWRPKEVQNEIKLNTYGDSLEGKDVQAIVKKLYSEMRERKSKKRKKEQPEKSLIEDATFAGVDGILPYSRNFLRIEFDHTASLVEVDLSGMQCAALLDDHGNNWNLRPGIRIKAAGIKCGRYDPSGVVEGVSRSLDATAKFQKGSENDYLDIEKEHASKHRKDWLSHQYSVQRIKDGQGWLRNVFPFNYYWTTTKEDLVPQTYDQFANGHIRAGEVVTGYDILVEKKDREAIVNLKYGLNWRRKALTGDKFTEQISKFERASVRTALIVALVCGLLFVASKTPWFPSRSYLSLVEICLWISFATAFSYLMWPAIVLLAQWFFRIGFRYGLSPGRALITFFSFVLMGWGAVDFARMGPYWDRPMSEIRQQSGGELDSRYVLVLNVPYEPTDPPGGEVDPTNINPNNQSIPEGRRIRGRAVYAEPAPCDLGVHSLLYTIDMFVPLINLHQRELCVVRDVPPKESHDPFLVWRLGFMLYELFGWIVSSLMILTLSGLMRRDIER